MFPVDGTEVNDINFENFKREKIFINYDFPRLILMSSPEGEKWIFSWLCNNELEIEDENKIIDRWIAFKISENRLKEIESGDISLRELILLCETFNDEFPPFYVFDSIGMFNAQEIWNTVPEAIPEEFLPVGDIPIIKKKALIPPPCFQSEKLNLDIHFLPTDIPLGEIPFGLLGPFQENFQNFVTRSAYSLFSQDYYIDKDDWTQINTRASATGSFRLYCNSLETNPDRVGLLERSCDFLKEICDGKCSVEIIEKYKSEIGDFAFYHLETFLKFIIQNNISVNIKWNYKSKEEWKSLILNKRKAQKTLKILTEHDKLRKKPITILIQLTEMEADEIRKPTPGTGGFQTLFEYLRKNLDDKNMLTISSIDIEKIIRYGLYYQEGGWQKRLQGVINALERMKVATTGLK